MMWEPQHGQDGRSDSAEPWFHGEHLQIASVAVYLHLGEGRRQLSKAILLLTVSCEPEVMRSWWVRLKLVDKEK